MSAARCVNYAKCSADYGNRIGWGGQVDEPLALLYMRGNYPVDFLLNAFCGNPH